VSPVEIKSYNVEDLVERLHEYEQEFGMSSAAFYRLHAEGLAVETVPPFDCVRWADTCRTAVRMAVPPVTPEVAPAPTALVLAQ
jgi:hypothetical protein